MKNPKKSAPKKAAAKPFGGKQAKPFGAKPGKSKMPGKGKMC